MYQNPYQAPRDAPEAGDELDPDYSPPWRARPRIWTALLAPVVAFCAAMAISVAIGIVWAIVLIESGEPFSEIDAQIASVIEDPISYILLLAFGQFPFLITPLLAAWLSPVTFRQRLGFVPSGLSAWQFVVVVLGSFVPVAIGWGLYYAAAQLVPPDESTERLYANMTWGTVVPFIACIALIPGFTEEILFRGYMQRRLLQRWSPWTAILVTSLVFAVVHMELHTVAFALPLGIWLGWVAWKTDSIWPCIATHAAVNAGWNIVACGMELTGTETLPLPLILGASAVGLAATVAAVRILQARRLNPEADIVASYATLR